MPTLDELLQQQADLEAQGAPEVQPAQHVPDSLLGKVAVGLNAHLQGRDIGQEFAKLRNQQSVADQTNYKNQQDSAKSQIDTALQQWAVSKKKKLDLLDDPNSVETQHIRDSHKKAIKSIDPKLNTSFVDTMTGTQLGDLTSKDLLQFALERSKAASANNKSDLAQQRLDRLESEDLDKFKERTIDKFNTDPVVKKARQTVEDAGRIVTLTDLSAKNPIAAAAIPTFMARASGEVGNLSEADKRPFGGSRSFLARFNQAATEAINGKLTPENQKFVKDLASLMQQRSQQVVTSQGQKFAKQKGQIRDGVDEKSILQLLDIQPEQADQIEIITDPASGRKVKVDHATKKVLGWAD